ncbi:hypothetical protein EVAR_36800_1 [Eumeta japonica]|uniref:Uncharacterized protein n=1 Tax=Eumeta variegata TaxID=151549 RepID=A0A4C1WYL3_EUMVA|nr:hypothetical protein EVAR_36800_1 [Eumeta japonica]
MESELKTVKERESTEMVSDNCINSSNTIGVLERSAATLHVRLARRRRAAPPARYDTGRTGTPFLAARTGARD